MIAALTGRDLARCIALAQSVGWDSEPTKWRMLLSLGRGCGTRIAETEDDAIELVDSALIGATGLCRIDVARSSPRFADHVRSLGFVGRGPAPLMILGATEAPGKRTQYHAIALQAFG